MFEWEYIGGDEPPPPLPVTEAAFLAEVTQLLAETGTGATLNVDELELLSPDEWDDFVMGLLGFFGATDGGSDQNSYYNDHSNEAPLGEDFIATFGWMPSVQNLPGYHFYDYLTQTMDPELMEAVLLTHQAQESLSLGGILLEDVEDVPLAMVVNGQLVTFTWHRGPPPATGVYPDGDAVVVTGSHGYWTCNFQPNQDQSTWTHTPLATDFMPNTIENWPFAAQVNEALQYLDNSPTALALMRAARLNRITIVLETNLDSYTTGSIVHWNPTAGLMINGQLQSPAMGLIHELAHALNWSLRIPHLPDPQYDNSEERRVIVEIETVVARELGEPSRTSHSGPETQTVFGVGITEHTPQPPS
jgi:hypothetical protein